MSIAAALALGGAALFHVVCRQKRAPALEYPVGTRPVPESLPYTPSDVSESARPVAAVFEFSSVYRDAYDRSLEIAGGQLRNQPERRFHVCFETDNGYMVVDVWDSLEAFEQFGHVLTEVMKQLPIPLQLKLRRIHNLI